MAALKNLYILLSKECFHSLPPAFIIGCSLSASQEKIFHDPFFRNWIENSWDIPLGGGVASEVGSSNG